MSEQIIDDENTQPDVKPTPGKRLRMAREALGLNQADIAIHLKLDVEKIEDLENDLVDKIVAPVFLSGYLRAYARLVNLSGDELIADFAQLAEMTSPSLKPTAKSEPGHLRKVPDKLPAHMTLASKGWSGIVIGALLILAILVAAALWWNNPETMQSENTPPMNEDVRQADGAIPQETLPGENAAVVPAPETPREEPAEQAEPAEAPKPKVEAEKVETPVAEIPKAEIAKAETAQVEVEKQELPKVVTPKVVTPKAEMEKQDSPLLAQENSAQPEVNAETINVVSANEDTTENNVPSLNAGQLALLAADSTPEATISDSGLSVDESILETEDNPELAPGEREELIIFLSEDSWVEVTDAIGQRLLYRLARLGDTLTVSGVAPFNVHLGYLPAVRILLNGEPYSLSRFGNRRSIRFQLDVDNKQQDNG